MKSLKSQYEIGRIKLGNDYEFYNLVEKCLLEIELTTDVDKSWFYNLDIKQNIINEIKGLGMYLSKFKPTDWKKFLDVIIK